MDVIETELPEVFVLIPRRFGDARGWFSETWNARSLADHGLQTQWVQDNQSFSAVAGTLRGLHYQAPPHAQAKLVRCLSGAIRDVAVDVRAGSPMYGRWTARDLTAEGGEQLYVPEGFLHGFLTLTPDAMVAYKCSDFYAPAADGAVRWDSLGIDWGHEGAPVVSEKDAAAPHFEVWESPFVWGAR